MMAAEFTISFTAGVLYIQYADESIRDKCILQPEINEILRKQPSIQLQVNLSTVISAS